MEKYLTLTNFEFARAIQKATRAINPQKEYRIASLTPTERSQVAERLCQHLQLDSPQADFLLEHYHSLQSIAISLYRLNHPDAPTGFIDLLCLRRKILRNLFGIHLCTAFFLFFAVFTGIVGFTQRPDALYLSLLFATLGLLPCLAIYLPLISKNRWLLHPIRPQAPRHV